MDDYEEEARLPTQLWLDGHLATLSAQGVYYYITNKGAEHSGLVLLKLNALDGRIRLIIQQRNFMTGKMEWAAALAEEMVEEPEADAYIQRAISRDPDLWVIEIEDPNLNNPFEGS